MKIKILGPGCMRCIKLEENVREAIKKLEINATIEKITDIDKIMEMGVMMTPALAIDDKVKSVGKVLSTDEIIKIIKGV